MGQNSPACGDAADACTTTCMDDERSRHSDVGCFKYQLTSFPAAIDVQRAQTAAGVVTANVGSDKHRRHAAIQQLATRLCRSEFVPRDVPRDGSCAFHAIAAELWCAASLSISNAASLAASNAVSPATSSASFLLLILLFPFFFGSEIH